MLKEIVREAIASHSVHSNNAKLLIAVSGGSDSMALLHLCSEVSNLNFEVATVDHGLRTEAADEARFVAEQCATLNVEHSTLTWCPDNKTSQAARKARYELLKHHAHLIGAGSIVLGHTLDDQAETLLMRAQRLKENSSSRGLSGMPELASYEEIKLSRPLLNVRREQLRAYLRNQGLGWIDDPSNTKLEYERVRVRNRLKNDQTLPSVEQIGRLAQLSGRHRHWLSSCVSDHIREHVSFDDSNLSLTYTANTPDSVIREIFLVLILASGEREFRVSDRKILDIVGAFQAKRKVRKAVGNCLVSVSGNIACFTKEVRKISVSQSINQPSKIQTKIEINSPACDGRPFAKALQHFRPTSDDSILEALLHIQQRNPR